MKCSYMVKIQDGNSIEQLFRDVFAKMSLELSCSCCKVVSLKQSSQSSLKLSG